jgi:beta-lactamase regulating signal transducer with metallopeptidase domain
MNPEFAVAWIAFNLGLCASLALRTPWRRWFGARASYQLWWFAPIFAAATLLPSGGAELAPVRGLVVSASLELPVAMAAPIAVGPEAWLLVWMAGSVAIGLAFVVAQIGTSRRWRASIRSHDPRCPQLTVVRADFGPALVGFVRPLLVLPTDFEQRYDPRQQTLVLAHEAAHAAAGDLNVRAAMLLLTIAQWWNPLAWLALSKLIEDQELACDARVIEAFPDDRALYARTLTAGVYAGASASLMCSLHQSHPLLRRIAMLNRNTPSSQRRRFAGLLTLLLTMSLSAIGWAADKGAPAIVESDSPSEYRVAVDLQVDDGPIRSYALGDRAGNRMQSTIDDGNDVIAIEVVVHETSMPGQVLLEMKVTRDGATLGAPKLAMLVGQTGRVEMGEKNGGAFTGVRMDAKVSRKEINTAKLAPFLKSEREAPVLTGIGFLLQEPGEGC